MAANYKLPLVVNKRVRFFDGQFLQDQDFVDEQKYNVGWQNRHHRTLHVAGVAEGLTLYKTQDSTQLQVNKGMAIDADGRQIILTKRSGIVELPTGDSWLYIAYHQVPDDLPSTSQGVEEETRWRDEPYIFTHVGDGPLGIDDTYEGPDWNGYLETADGPPPPVLLAKVTVADNGTITTDESVRRYSGLRLPGPNTAAPTLRADTGGNVGLWMVHNNDEVERLTITSEGRLGLGTTTPGAALEINNTLTATSTAKTLVGLKISPTYNSNGKTGVKQYGLLVESGYVGIGEANPATNLEVRGVARAGTNSGNYTEISHGGTHGYVNKVGVGRLEFRHDGDTKMTLSESAQLGVGIGSMTPNSVLHIKSAAANSGLTIQTGDNNKSQGIAFQNSGGAYVWHLFRQQTTYQNNSNYAKLVVAGGADSTITNLTPFATFTPSGDVGIGLTSPSAKLDVDGTIRANYLRINPQNDSGEGGELRLDGSGGNDELKIDNYHGHLRLFNLAEDKYLRVQGSARIDSKAGIGQAPGTETLEVAGAIRATSGLYMDTKSTAPQSAAGWHRIAQGIDTGGNKAGIFEIRWAAAGRHGHVRFAAGANYGDDDGAQITILDQSSYGGKVIEKLRLLMRGDSHRHYFEFYFNGSIHENYAIPFEIYLLSGYGWALVEPTAGSVPSNYAAHEIRANVMFATRSGKGNNSLFVIENGANVGVGTAEPMHRLDVNGRMHLDRGVIQRGGDAITNTTDLGLYSRIEGNWIRIVTNDAPIKFFTDDGIGSSAKLTINTDGTVSAGSLNANNIIQTAEKLRTIRGTVKADGSKLEGAGFSVSRPHTGTYDVTFSSAFSDRPTVVVSQQHPDDNNTSSGKISDRGGNTRDNATVVGVTNSMVRIKTGNGDGDASNRRFHFIAIGPR